MSTDPGSTMPTPPESPETRSNDAQPTNTQQTAADDTSPETPTRKVGDQPLTPPTSQQRPSTRKRASQTALSAQDNEEEDESIETIPRDPRDFPSPPVRRRRHSSSAGIESYRPSSNPTQPTASTDGLRRSKTQSRHRRSRAGPVARKRYSLAYDADTESDDEGRYHPTKQHRSHPVDDSGDALALTPVKTRELARPYVNQSQGQMAPVARGRRASVGKAALRVKLDLNLSVEIVLKARIHGDLTLSIL